MCARSWVLVCVKVAFLQSETRAPQEVEAELPFVVDSWFIINRAVDMIFIIDIILQFFLPVPDAATGELIRSHYLLARKYCLTWFWLDFFTVIPFDIMTLTVRGTLPRARHRLVHARDSRVGTHCVPALPRHAC